VIRTWRFVAALAASTGASCLPDPAPVDGRRLVASRGIERPAFETVDEAAFILYDVRRAPVQPGRGGVTDVHVVSWDTGEERLLVAGRSDTPGWSHRDERTGIRYFMIDERRPTDGGAGTVATLVRVSLAAGVLERVEEVASFTPMGGDRFMYNRPVPGSPLKELHLRVPSGEDRLVGRPTGQVQYLRDDRIYFVGGEDRSWLLYRGPDRPPDRLRGGVSRFLLKGDETLAVLVVTEMGRPQTSLFDMATRTERKLPVTNPCCWLRFDGNTFVFGESANPAAGAPAKLHFYDTVKEEDRVVAMPEGLSDVTGFGSLRPGHPAEIYYFDSRRRIAIQRPGADPPFRLLPMRPLHYRFTDKGDWFLFIEPDSEAPPPGEMPAGRLMVVDGDFATAPRQLSPPGALVPANGFFFIDGPDPIVFWAHYGRGASDLFFADHASGRVRVVAQGISEVTVTPREIFGIVRVSLQDLTGDLVRRNTLTGTESRIEASVSDFAVTHGGRLAVVIRERAASPDRDGLWAISLDERR
jgi:hypothetical protein